MLRDPDAADDLVQSTLERALARWRLRRDDGDLKAWLYTIQRNLYCDMLRARQRAAHATTIAQAQSSAYADGDPEAALIARDALSRLDALPEEQRTLLLLVGVEDLSYAQAARALGVPVGTIMSRLSRARAALRRRMESGSGAVLRRVK